MEGKFINRFESFCNSLSGLAAARSRDLNDEFVLSGTVQKFNLTFDISWKVMKDIVVKYYKIQDFATGSPREVFRKAKSVNLIRDDIWLDMLNDRNELAHDYDGTFARECVETVVSEYIAVFEEFKSEACILIDKMKKE